MYIPTQQKNLVNRDVRFVEDAWSFKSQDPKVEEGEKILVPKSNKKKYKTYKDQQGSTKGTRASLVSSSPKKIIWLTKTLQGGT